MNSNEINNFNSQQQNEAIIFDSQILFAESFVCLLKTMHLFNIVNHTNREDELWKSFLSKKTTHVFLDYNIRGVNTYRLVKKIIENFPCINVVIVSTTQNVFIIQRMLNAGVKAFISKTSRTAELSVCLQSIAIGRKYLSPDLKLLMNEHANDLHPINFTDKEIQVLRSIADGCTISQTADILRVSKHTIVAHRRNMMGKTGINSAPGLVKFGMDAGLITV
ncbi:MAG: response regulator transcription factor [Bacteroidota bacterium]